MGDDDERDRGRGDWLSRSECQIARKLKSDGMPTCPMDDDLVAVLQQTHGKMKGRHMHMHHCPTCGCPCCFERARCVRTK